MPERFPIVQMDAYIVMPNHFHAIIAMVEAPLVGAPSRAGTRPAPTTLDETKPVSTALDETRPGQNEADTRPASTALGDVVGAFKSITTVKYIRRVRDSVWAPFEKRLWQRNYYERIIRNEHALGAIRRYIRDNPARWEADGVNPNPGAWLKEA